MNRPSIKRFQIRTYTNHDNQFLITWDNSMGSMDLSHVLFYRLTIQYFAKQIEFIFAVDLYKDCRIILDILEGIKCCYQDFLFWRKSLFDVDSFEYKNIWVFWWALRVSSNNFNKKRD